MRTYHVYARCNLPHGVCPYCGHVSRSVHSRYHRTIADLSIIGHPVIITFEARKFFCHNPDCRKKTFAEQPGDEVFRYRRRTRRCEMVVTQHGLKCSSDVKSFQAWLDEHVQVEVVSRDRSTDYTAAIAATGRNITEVADRFHLNMNMSDCVTKVIGSHYDEYRSAVRPEEVQETPEVDSRQVMFKEVKELQAEGLNIAQISKKLDIARQTVRKYMGRDTLPKRAGKERLPYYLYDTYVEEEYRHGKDLRKIFMEIKGKGFPGSLTPFYDHYSYLSDGNHGHRSGQEVEKMKQRPNCDREPLLPIRQIAHIVDKSIRIEKMVHAEVALVEKMMSYGWVRDIYNAASSFHATIMGNDVDELDSWLDSYGKSPIKELRSFAYGIRMDLKAVKNAITLDTSNGIVEGFVNKLKAVKRVMFGRASLDLLKRKMVFSDLCFN